MIERDHVTEKEFAALYNTTKKALEARRHRGQIPADVWKILHGKVYYSIRRYEAWLESLWSGQQVSSQSETESGSASCGKGSAAAKPSHTRKLRRASKQHPVLELR